MSNHTMKDELEWHTSIWPFILSVGILFLVPLAFSFYFVYKNPLLAVIAFGIGAPLTLISIVGWVKEGIEDKHHYNEGHSIWAMPIFVLVEAMLFIGFFAAYWVLRFTAPVWPPQGTPEMPLTIPIIMTIILLSSSGTIYLAESKMEEGDNSNFIKWLMVTIALGALFLGFKALEWTDLFHEGFLPKTNIYSTAFFSLTGFHGSHVLVGIGMFICALIPAFVGKVNKAYVTSVSIYWHFVDVVWLFVVSQVYFL